MCSDWKVENNGSELTTEQIRDIFRNQLFTSTEKFALSGGEPVLREDLGEIAQIVLESCPRINELVLLTNGLEPALVSERVKEIIGIANRNRLKKLAVSVSIDGYGEVQERIRRVPRAFDRVSESVTKLKELQQETPFYLSAVCVVQPSNIGDLVELADFGEKLELPITFVPIQVGDYYVN
jgi:MoaA/NifB/PqqE/SkfB family radical SAM enzyme